MESEEQQARDQAEELEARADELEERKDDFGEEVEDVKQDWEEKQESSQVPGAQDESGAGGELADADPQPEEDE